MVQQVTATQAEGKRRPAEILRRWATFSLMTVGALSFASLDDVPGMKLAMVAAGLVLALIGRPESARSPHP
ncbi:MAG: hypothetical protein R2882_07890 [Gemmatimonadales bacterium]